MISSNKSLGMSRSSSRSLIKAKKESLMLTIKIAIGTFTKEGRRTIKIKSKSTTSLLSLINAIPQLIPIRLLTAIEAVWGKSMMGSCSNSLLFQATMKKTKKRKARMATSPYRNGRKSIMTFYYRKRKIWGTWEDLRREEKEYCEDEWYVNIVVNLL